MKPSQQASTEESSGKPITMRDAASAAAHEEEAARESSPSASFAQSASHAANQLGDLLCAIVWEQNTLQSGINM